VRERERGRGGGEVTHPTMDAQRSDTFNALDVTTLREVSGRTKVGERELK
jgi:hypothetical protein